MDGLWGTICKRFWDDPEASAFCRSLGFNTGFPYHKNADLRADDHVPIYEPNMHCKGKENSLLDCPHEGWKRNFSKTCELHDMDATVHCYNTSKAFFTLHYHFFEYCNVQIKLVHINLIN